MKIRIIVVPIIKNSQGELLLCKMPDHRGVFPGQWGLPGGGLEEGESMIDALHREVREELGITVTQVTPRSFRDDLQEKRYPDGRQETVYMVYLLFDCLTEDLTIQLSDEFEAYEWVRPEQINDYDLNAATTITFQEYGIL
jgi:nucleoside triphosphatase